MAKPVIDRFIYFKFKMGEFEYELKYKPGAKVVKVYDGEGWRKAHEHFSNIVFKSDEFKVAMRKHKLKKHGSR